MMDDIDSSSDFQLFHPALQIFGTPPSMPVIIGIPVTLMFHNISSYLEMFKYLYLF